MTERQTTARPTSNLDIARIYDAYAPRLHAIALRITGDRALAAAVVEDLLVAIAKQTLAFDGRGSFDAWLIRRVRDYALARRKDRTAAATVDLTDGSPTALIEAAYFGGASVAELANSSSLSEEEVRNRLRDGMRAVRDQFARSGRQR